MAFWRLDGASKVLLVTVPCWMMWGGRSAQKARWPWGTQRVQNHQEESGVWRGVRQGLWAQLQFCGESFRSKLQLPPRKSEKIRSFLGVKDKHKGAEAFKSNIQAPPELSTTWARSLPGEQEEPQSFTLQEQGQILYRCLVRRYVMIQTCS